MAVLFCRKRKISFLNFADYLVPYLALGQSIGRWGNFINQEAYGSITNSFFKMTIFEAELGEFVNVHPTFLYESVLDFFIFLILMLERKKRKFPGQLLLSYLILYGIGRAIIENFRADSLMLGSIRVSGLVGVISAIFGICFWIFVECCRRKGKNVD